MNSSKYSVVDFGKDEGVAVVCSAWIFKTNGTTLCFWPPYKSTQMCNRVVEKCQSAQPAWKSYECRVLYSTDDYAKARLKLNDSEMTSSLESEIEGTDGQNLKRRRDQCPTYQESSGSGSDAEQQITKRPAILTKSMPKPTPPPPPPPPPPPQQPNSKLPQSDSPRSVGAGRNSAFERHILTALQEIKDSVAEVKKDIAILRASQLTQSNMRMDSTSSEEMPEGISFPLECTEEVAALEAKLLQDTSVKQLIMRNFSSIGGASASDCTRRLLREIFSNRCAKNMNWKGRGGKLAVSGLSLTSIIIKAVRMNALTRNASHAEIESHIKDWLKFATERDGGRKKRAEKLRQSRTEQASVDSEQASVDSEQASVDSEQASVDSVN